MAASHREEGGAKIPTLDKILSGIRNVEYGALP